jgi:hypothetical protein
MDGFQPCAHCGGTGTCNRGPNAIGCQICFAHWRERYPKMQNDPAGAVKCSTCWGRGIVEPPGATKWDYKTPAYLGAALAGLSFLLLFVLLWKGSDELFSKTLVFVGTLIGSITGYYFGGQKRVPAKSGDDPKATEIAPPA